MPYSLRKVVAVLLSACMLVDTVSAAVRLPGVVWRPALQVNPPVYTEAFSVPSPFFTHPHRYVRGYWQSLRESLPPQSEIKDRLPIALAAFGLFWFSANMPYLAGTVVGLWLLKAPFYFLIRAAEGILERLGGAGFLGAIVLTDLFLQWVPGALLGLNPYYLHAVNGNMPAIDRMSHITLFNRLHIANLVHTTSEIWSFIPGVVQAYLLLILGGLSGASAYWEKMIPRSQRIGLLLVSGGLLAQGVAVLTQGGVTDFFVWTYASGIISQGGTLSDLLISIGTMIFPLIACEPDAQDKGDGLPPRSSRLTEMKSVLPPVFLLFWQPFADMFATLQAPSGLSTGLVMAATGVILGTLPIRKSSRTRRMKYIDLKAQAETLIWQFTKLNSQAILSGGNPLGQQIQLLETYFRIAGESIHYDESTERSIAPYDVLSEFVEQDLLVPAAARLFVHTRSQKVRYEAGLFLIGEAYADEKIRQQVGETFAEFILDHGLREGSLKHVRTLWNPETKDALERRMPTLLQILNNPASTERCLYVLSLMRLHKDYDEKPDPRARIRIRDLILDSSTGSFRRHLIRTATDEPMPYAIEVKIPGEAVHRDFIPDTHFRLARKLWQRYPGQPGVVQPLFFAEFKGRTTLYRMKRMTFDEYPMGIAGFLYSVPGVRAIHADAEYLVRLAMRLRISPYQLQVALSVDGLVAALQAIVGLQYRLHGEGGTDAHPENIRIQEDGRAVLVGDFGVGTKRKRASPDAFVEALTLAGADKAATHRLGFAPVSYLILAPEVIIAVARRVIAPLPTRSQRLSFAIGLLEAIGSVTSPLLFFEWENALNDWRKTGMLPKKLYFSGIGRPLDVRDKEFFSVIMGEDQGKRQRPRRERTLSFWMPFLIPLALVGRMALEHFFPGSAGVSASMAGLGLAGWVPIYFGRKVLARRHVSEERDDGLSGGLSIPSALEMIRDYDPEARVIRSETSSSQHDGPQRSLDRAA